ncbi:MAG: SPOR domain-containing protein [Flavobacteriales bacterium]
MINLNNMDTFENLSNVKMKNSLFSIILIFSIFSPIWGQDTDSVSAKDTTEDGGLVVKQPQKLDSMLADYKKINKEFPGIEGYRINLYFGERDSAKKIRKEYKDAFGKDSINTYINWYKPNFRLRIGNFRTKLQAERYKLKIEERFPEAYVIKTKIELPQLNIGKPKDTLKKEEKLSK